MSPEHAKSFGGGAATSMIHPIVLIGMILAIILIFILPRKYVMIPLFCTMFLVPLGEQLVLGGVHLFVSRILILVGLARMVVSPSTATANGEKRGLNSVDQAFLWCAVCQAVAVMLLFRTPDALVNQAGFILDYLGGYFLLRFLIQDEQDIERAIKCFSVLALFLAVCMVQEQRTLQNVFGLIGGAPVPDLREGRVRSQGPFSHALMAGAFGATLVPLCLALWKSGKAKFIAAVGIVGGLLMTWASNASTSLLTVVAALVAVCFWPLRDKMKKVRWAVAFGLIALHLIMKAPVWFLIAHIDLTGTSSNYHRAVLIDSFIRHFTDWVLIGVKDTGSWGWDLWDAQNQFVNVGETGGLLALIFFIVMISRCFGYLGTARKAVEGDKNREWFFWLLGAALFANVTAFFGVNYFDNMKFAWFALLAMISAATLPYMHTKEVPSIEMETGLGRFRRKPALVTPSNVVGKGVARAQKRASSGSIVTEVKKVSRTRVPLRPKLR
jgi:hypothetical protein